MDDETNVLDVYTPDAVGSAANSGLTPLDPKDTIQGILDAYDLGPDDRVYIDTGTYVLSETLVIGPDDSGAELRPMSLIGSTDPTIGTLIDRADPNFTVISVAAANVSLQNLRVLGGLIGIDMAHFLGPGTESEVINCEIVANELGIRMLAPGRVEDSLIHRNAAGVFLDVEAPSIPAILNGNTIRNNDDGAGITLVASVEAGLPGSDVGAEYVVTNNIIRDNGAEGIRVTLLANSASLVFVNNSIAGNDAAGIALEMLATTAKHTVIIANNLVQSDTLDVPCVELRNLSTDSTIDFDHNDYFVENEAPVGAVDDGTVFSVYKTLEDWQNETSLDANSISADPLVIDALNGDYHLRSDSPCLDAGSNVYVQDLGLQLDIDGDERIRGEADGGIVDIGADEFSGPTTPSIEISPVSGSEPRTLDDLVCTITVPSDVATGVAVQYEYVWTNDVIEVAGELSTDETNTLSSAFTVKHDLWKCTVRAFDGESYSAPRSVVVTILNTPAEDLRLRLLASEIVNEDDPVRCVFIRENEDPDGDIEYDVVWYREGEVWVDGEPVNFRDEFTQVNPEYTAAGEQWYCEVTATDNESVPVVRRSVIIEVIEAAIVPSLISLALDPAVVTLGESITISGEIFRPSAEDVGCPDIGSCEIDMEYPGYEGCTLVSDCPEIIEEYPEILTACGYTAEVSFQTTSPSGEEMLGYPDGVTVCGQNEESTYVVEAFLPMEASEGQPEWSMTASWAGDDVYSGDESSSVTYTVLKAEPALTLGLSASSGALEMADLTATVTLSASLPPELAHLLEGQPIVMSVLDPNEIPFAEFEVDTLTGGVATFTPTHFSDAGVTFDTLGLYKFQVSYAGDINFLAVESPEFDEAGAGCLTIKDPTGYAVLVVGALDDQLADTDGVLDRLGEGQVEHTRAMDYVYRTLLARGFEQEDIYYLREDVGSGLPPGDIAVYDETPSKADLETLLTATLPGRVNETPAPVYLVMIGHGLDDAYYVFSGNFDDSRIVTATDLNGYLDALRAGLTGVAGDETMGEPADQPFIIVNGSGHSGSFIDELSRDNRLIITSSKGGQESHLGALEPDGAGRGGEVFLTGLFRGLGAGDRFKEAFESASGELAEYTLSRSNPAVPGASVLQEALLDDNGDGGGSTASGVSFTAGFDGALAADLELGVLICAGNESIGWEAVSPTIYLGEFEDLADDENVVVATADAVGDNGDVAWIEIKNPAYSGSTPAATGESGGGEDLGLFQQVVDMVAFDSTNFDPDTGVYGWTASTLDRSTNSITLEAALSDPGTYSVYYFIKDGDTGVVAGHRLSTVYRNVDGNDPPSQVTLVLPEDGAVLDVTTAFFAWSPSEDPPDHHLTYRLEVDTADTFDTSALFVIDRLTNVFAATSKLADGQTYFWRVIAEDEFGAQSPPSEFWSFSVVAENPALQGRIAVLVNDAETGDPISGATVIATEDVADPPPSLIFGENSLGSYVRVDVPSALYILQVSLDGYVTSSTDSGVFRVDNWTFVQVELSAAVDSDGDGLLDSEEDLNGDGILDDGETDPFDPDTDGDGINDYDEVHGDTDPRDDDSDGDGFKDGLEVDDGTDPTDPDSFLPKEQAWVEIGRTDARKGTIDEPVDRLSDALAIINPDGKVTFVNGGDNPDPVPLTVTTGVTIEALNGTVVFGAAVPEAAVAQHSPSNAIVREVSSATVSGGYDEADGDGGPAGAGTAGGAVGAAGSVPVILDRFIYAPVMPYTQSGDSEYQAAFDARLSLRLRAGEAIDLGTLWADIAGHDSDDMSIDWVGADGASANDLWVHFSAPDGWLLDARIDALSGAVTLRGHEVAYSKALFRIENAEEYAARAAGQDAALWQPLTGDDFSTDVTVTLGASTYPELADAAGPVYSIGPEQVFAEAQRVWLPMAPGVDGVDVYYYHPNGPDRGWYPADHVLGWLVPDSALTLDLDDGSRYLGLLVRHAAIVHLGEPRAE